MEQEKKRKVILDTDIGLDDCESIIYLTACKDVELLALTLVAGNASMPIISENCRKIFTFLNKEHIPIYEAGSYNLMGELIKSDGYFGDNAFANIQLPESSIQIDKSICAAQAIVNLVKKYPHEVSLICIGPLTNLALAFLIDNSIPELFDSIFIMGCDRAEKTRENVTPYAEFNAHCDPVAYQVVSNCFKNVKNPITIVEFSCCQNHLLQVSMLDQLYTKGQNNVHTKLMSIIRDFANPIISRSLRNDLFLTCDPFASCGWHDSTIFANKRRVSLKTIDIMGEKLGHTVFEDDPNGIFEIVLEVNIKKMEENIINVLLGAH